MSDWRAAAKQRHSTLMRIEVPEWSVDPAEPTVFYSKPLTLKDRIKCRDLANGDAYAVLVHILIRKLLHKNGKQVFDLGDKHFLMDEVDDDVVSRIAARITSGPTQEELEKNSGTIPTASTE